MHVLKFGGTSVKNAARIKRVADIIKTQEDKTFVVVSALSGVTNSLTKLILYGKQHRYNEAFEIADDVINKHKETFAELKLPPVKLEFIDEQHEKLNDLITALQILGETSPKSQDMILSFGERLSAFLLFNTLLQNRVNAVHADARLLIKTDERHTAAECDINTTHENIRKFAAENSRHHDVIITEGFIGSDAAGKTTTLGRGGSDYTASIIASTLKADLLDIYTDVYGMMTSDPRFIPEAKLIRNISYTEASELAYFGAKVLHPKTIWPAVQSSIPVRILNTFDPENSGTVIRGISSKHEMIKAIAFRKGISIININSNRMLGAFGFLARVFEVFEKHETSVDLVSTSEVNISLTIDNEDNLDKINEDLSKFSDINVLHNMAIISAIGEGIRDTAGIAARFFGTLRGVNIPMVSIGASEVNLSIVLSEKDVESSVKALHKEFFENDLDKEIFVEIKNPVSPDDLEK